MKKLKFNKKLLHKHVPIISWLPKYSSTAAVGDLITGITVGMTLIPQGMAYARLAGFDVQYGLYSSIIASFTYFVFGTCREVIPGPLAVGSMLMSRFAGGKVERAILLSFLCGFVEILMGIFGLGFLVEFISMPVFCGFNCAIALGVISSQIKDLFALTKVKGETVVEKIISTAENLSSIQLWDSLMGIGCLIVLILMQQLTKLKGKSKFIKAIGFVSLARNAIVLLLSGLISYCLPKVFKTIGHIPPGLPSFHPPPFSLPEIRDQNGTIIQKHESFTDMLSIFNYGVILIPFILYLEHITVCKAFSKGKEIYPSQEQIAIGLGNICNPFLGGYCGYAALSRGAIAASSGAQTTACSAFSGIIVILALLTSTPFLSHVPMTTLAAIVLASIVHMIKINKFIHFWNTKITDFICAITTCLACSITTIEIGIWFGIGLNFIFVLSYIARPKVEVEILKTTNETKYLQFTPDRCLIYPAVERLRRLIRKKVKEFQMPVVIDCSNVFEVDYTAITVFKTLMDELDGYSMYFINVPQHFLDVVTKSSFKFNLVFTNFDLEKTLDGQGKCTKV